MYHVYLVDDDAVILEELYSCVSWLDHGFNVVGHTTFPLTAIEEITALKPDLVISDLKMEPLDGIQLMQTLKKRGFSPYFLLISGYGSFENSRRFFVEGGFDYLLKPLDKHEIQLTLDRLYVALSTTTPSAPPLKACNPIFNQLLQYLQERYNEKHTLESLSKQFSLSANYICTLFSKHCDTTLTHYITSLRMKIAKQEIKQNNQSMKEIAHQCGYHDYRYFNRVFKEYYGVSPAKFKEEANK